LEEGRRQGVHPADVEGIVSAAGAGLPGEGLPGEGEVKDVDAFSAWGREGGRESEGGGGKKGKKARREGGNGMGEAKRKPVKGVRGRTDERRERKEERKEGGREGGRERKGGRREGGREGGREG
jgi:hypothetical protein